ncbi:9191_t:CDS:2, partial [Entrophospora sp. SA101]
NTEVGILDKCIKPFTSIPTKGFGVKTAHDVKLKVKKDFIELTSKDFKNSHITVEDEGDYTTYLMDKIVINTPALNKLNGKTLPAEINFVYKKERNGSGNNPNNLAILTTLYKFGKFGGSPFWDEVIKALKRNKKMDVLKFKNLLDITDSHNGFNYDGTLTSPPCKPVEWSISSKIHAISISQFRALKAAMKKR